MLQSISAHQLPPPLTFAEGQRYIYGLLAAAAGVFCGAAAVAMVALLMWGGWNASEQHSVVVIFGWSLAGFIAAMVAVIVGLLAGGPVGRFKLAASREGATIEADCPDCAMMGCLLNPQGIVGIAVAAALAGLLLLAKIDARHWHKQADQYQQLYRGEQAAFATTVADYRVAADAARQADRANVERVAAQQSAITERTANDFQARLADARARSVAVGLRRNSQADANSGAGGSAAVPGLPDATGRASEAASEDRLSQSDRLTATEQAIQLDELIKWVRAQAKVDNNAGTGARSPE